MSKETNVRLTNNHYQINQEEDKISEGFFKHKELASDLDRQVESALEKFNKDRETPLQVNDLLFDILDRNRGAIVNGAQQPAHIRVQLAVRKGWSTDIGYNPRKYGWIKLKPLRRNVRNYLENVKGMTKAELY